MRVVLDARWIFDEISGIGLYTQELIRNLSQVDPENEYVLLFEHARLRDRTEEETGFGRAANFTSRLVRHGVFSRPVNGAFPDCCVSWHRTCIIRPTT